MHRDFEAQVDKIDKAFQDGEMAIVKPIMGLLQGWLMDHIMKVDRGLAKALNERGLK
jgi:hemerythrin